MKGRWISVTASGEASVAPDTALITFAVAGNDAELAALRDDVNSRSSAVLSALRGLAVAEADLDAPDLVVQPIYDYRRGQRLSGYRVARNMSVRVRELERVGEVLDALSREGANEVHGTQMTASDPSAAEHAALEAAVRAAQAKAAVLARSAGVTLGPVARIDEERGFGGPPQPMLRMAAAMESADAPTEVVTGDLHVILRVRVRFMIG